MTATTPGTAGTSDGRGPAGEKSLGELVATATRDLSTLIRSEVQLAKVEIKQEVTSAGKGAGLLGGAGFLGVLALVFLSVSAAYGISWLGVPLGCAFFTVGALYAIAAAALALTGRKNLQKVGPPERTIETVKDDVAWARHPTQAPTRTH
ncbi:MAG TPA: phage holin family protein [Mycobacteriales bacterium]|nr:phage holin family protein [Mycobacteriales bacterium]